MPDDDPHPDPVTSQDIQGLREDTQGLTQSIDTFATKADVADERISRRREALGAVLLVAVVLLVVFFAAIRPARQSADHAQTVADANAAQLSAAQADQAAARRGSCIQFNVNQASQRDAIVLGITDALRKVFGDTERGAQFATDLEPALRESVSARLPYRDCSPAGIEAFLKKPPQDPATVQGG